MTTIGEHAVVLGGSMAGLLAARVLSEHYAQVTVVERDPLPAAGGHRRGVPQSRHVHGILPRGRELLDELFSGLTGELVAAGALTGDALGCVRWLLSGCRLAQTTSGSNGLFASRPLLEDRVRARVRDIPAVTIRDGCAAVGLVAAPSHRQIIGVQLLRADAGAADTLAADLVIDATGRGSRTPAWLAELGYPLPHRDKVTVGVRYASRMFRLRAGALGHDRLIITGGTAAHPRGGALTAIEGGRHHVSLAGMLGDTPSTDLPGFLRFAQTLPFPDIHRAILDAEPLDDGAAFGYPASTRVCYERLNRFPAGLLVIGDAVCTLNPIYGQGMTVAAMQAMALRRMLTTGAAPAASRYFRQIAKVITVPWDIAVGGDLANPAVVGPRTVKTRLVNTYLPRLHAAAANDPALARAFVRVSGLIDRPESLLRPDRLARVLTAPGRQPSAATADAQPGEPEKPECRASGRPAVTAIGASRHDCQVLVAGAGPTGLVLACELLTRGIRARIIDKGDGVVLQTRALGVHARTLEVFDMMGLADRFLDHGQVVRRFHMYTDGRTLVRLDLGRTGSAFGFMLDVPQQVTETILRQRVADLGGTVEDGTELRSLRVDPGGVSATVTGPAGTSGAITADYLVGADGAHSRVRSELGLGFEGHPYAQDWLLADVRLGWDRPDDEMHAFFPHEGRPLICMPMRDHLWRVILPLAGQRDPGAPALEEIRQLVGERAPEPVPVSDPAWLATFQCHRRSTSVYRRGRVLLAGDAVHIHSPAGGQGMNTGIMDAHNLAWKLALVASGRAPEKLLDSYGAERCPVAADVLALTHALVKLGTMTNPVQRAVRNTIVPLAGRLAPVQRRAVRRISHIHVAYPSSPLTYPDRNRGGVRPGQRVPDLEVTADGHRTRLYQILRRGRHVLLIAGPRRDLPSGMRVWQDRIEVVTTSAALVPAGSIYLLRPDGYLAARGSAANPDNPTRYLNLLFGARPGRRLTPALRQPA
jgi:2-polyprenyl-6-methoxyphenol hydroxylase-like FAD-dependent oxidoreductase